MAQPPTIYKPGPLNYVWQQLSKSNAQYATVLAKYMGIPQINANIELLQEFANNPTLLLNMDTVGPKVSFTKENYGDQVDVIIPGALEITRGNNGRIYNKAVEPNGNGPSPGDTEWNSDGWFNIEACESRIYVIFDQAVDSYPAYNTLLRNFVMRHIPTGRMWLIKFNSWTAGNLGGGFSWDRYEIFTSVTFTRADYAGYGPNARDIIHPGKLEIARRNDKYGIWNYPYEYNITVLGNNGNGAYDDDYAMMFTQWNSQWSDPVNNGFSDLSNIRTRTYDSFVNALDGSVGNNIVGAELIMHDLITNRYYKFLFTDWTTNGNGGGFAYTRTLIPQNSAINFADGSALVAAPPIPPPTYRANVRQFTPLLPILVSENINTMGSVNWSYITAGVYQVDFPTGSLNQNTYINLTQQDPTPGPGGPGMFTIKTSNYLFNQIIIEYYDNTGTLANPFPNVSFYIEVI